ncbi:MAG: DegT/DnrJ/EryC1/StrS family aminotransferase [Candidatus Micrarchaeota archaeon]|nr:DegT/DnrJ/EryC1/StrS family aminotransferase [Candidatus Micrarchaeota archaeon]
MARLALLGGPKTRSIPFPPHPVLDERERKAVLSVLESGRLSTFVAAPGKHFLGGEKIREFEQLFADYHKVQYAVAFNSATAALHAAVVACGVQPGEEVVTTPYTFTSTATSALMANAVPVFADVDAETFNISPDAIEERISPLTKAITPVHLFGAPADMDRIMQIAKKHGLKVIEDCAQAPGARYRGKLVGTIGDCGVFSFTENKNITSGEGGMLITNDERIADVARLVRNHGEAVVANQPRTYSSSILGWNYRMTEIDAAIGIEQFKKMDQFNQTRNRLAKKLISSLSNMDWLAPQRIPPEDYSAFYVVAFRYDEQKIGIPRKKFVDALNAEGIPFGAGYVKPLYYSPIYHENRPFIYRHYRGAADYSPGVCPVAERLHFRELIMTLVCRPPATESDIDDIVSAVGKIIENKHELEAYNP